MTPFEIAAGVLATVDFGLKVYNSMDAFAAKVKNADKTAQDLSRRVDVLRNTFYAVSTILKKRREQLDGKEPGTEAETKAWVAISNTINSWRETVRQFKEVVEELDTGPKGRRRSWVAKMLWHYKHGDAIPILQGFQNDIVSHNAALSLLLQCIIGWERAYEKNNAPAVIKDEVCGLDRALSEAKKQGSYNSDAATERISRCIALAQATKNALKGGSMAGQLTESLKYIEIVQYDDQDMRGDEWADIGDEGDGSSDSDVDNTFDDTTPREMAEALVQHYDSDIPFDPEDKESLSITEYHQRRFLMYAKEWNRVYEPQIHLGPIERKLARILDAQGKFGESQRLLKRGLTPGPELLSTSRRPSETSLDREDICYRADHCDSLAETYLSHYRAKQKQKHLDLAELYAKRCVALRLELRDDSESFLMSVRRLVEVVRRQRHSIEAEVYRRLYLAESSRKPSDSSMESSGSSIERPDWSAVQLVVLNQPYVAGMTPLIAAIQTGDICNVEALIRHGVSPEARDSKDRTPLLYAAFKQNDRVIDILIKRGASIDALCNNETALHYAIRRGKSRVVTCLLDRGAGVEELSKDGFSPLTLAVRQGRDDIVLLLCERESNRPDLDARDSHGLTALHHAVQARFAKILEILLEHHAMPDIQSTKEGSNMPLHEAIIQNHEASAEVLLKHRANVNCTDGSGRTPFLIAVRARETKKSLIKLLIDKGAHVDERGFDKKRLPPDVRRYLKNAKSAPRRRMSADSSASSEEGPLVSAASWKKEG